MALKDTISKWHAAVCYLEENYHSQCVHKLLEIKNPSAKIIYNVGCVYLLLQDYNTAIQYFDESINKDRYLMIAYFLRGVCHCRVQRFDLAQKDFLGIQASLPQEGINYQQLGAAISLTSDMVTSWLQASKHGRGKQLPPLQPVLDLIFRPPKKMVASMKKEDFLGRAKVISSVQQDDILYAEEKKGHNPPFQSQPTPALPTSPVPQLRRLPKGGASKAIPPPPTRKPPHLTPSVRDRCRRRWKSMELLSDNQDEDETSSSSGSAGSRIHDRRSCSGIVDDGRSLSDYSNLSDDMVDPDNKYQVINLTSMNQYLLASCPSVDVSPDRPSPPPRPKSMNVSSRGRPNRNFSNSNMSTSNISDPKSTKDEMDSGISSHRPTHNVIQQNQGTPDLSVDAGSKSVLARAHPLLLTTLRGPASSHPKPSPVQPTHPPPKPYPVRPLRLPPKPSAVQPIQPPPKPSAVHLIQPPPKISTVQPIQPPPKPSPVRPLQPSPKLSPGQRRRENPQNATGFRQGVDDSTQPQQTQQSSPKQSRASPVIPRKNASPKPPRPPPPKVVR